MATTYFGQGMGLPLFADHVVVEARLQLNDS